MIEISGIGAASAFAGGLISFLSPCVLPLVPGYVSYIAGRSFDELEGSAAARVEAIALSLCFILGFSAVFIAFGASATAVGRLLLAHRYELNIIGGVLVLLFGLLMTGLLRVPWLAREFRFIAKSKGGNPVGAFVLGLAFAFGWTPCIGPVLGAILTVAASTAGTVDGVTLLSIYSLGLGAPFLLAAAFTRWFAKLIRRARRLGRLFQAGAGVVMMTMGVAMISGYMTALSYWLLEHVPILAQIG